MIGIDANVLLRFTVRDDEVQASRAEQLLTGCTANDPALISTPVLCEYVWSLRHRYKWPHQAVAERIQYLIRDPKFRIQERDCVASALFRYISGPADFTDYLIGEIGLKCGSLTTYTFDRRAAGEPDFTLLTVDGA